MTLRSAVIRISTVALLLAVLQLGKPALSLAQQGSGGISGTVKDPAGANVIDADVTLQNAQQLVFGRTKTDNQGRFELSNISPGSYVLLASRSDFSDGREVVRVTEDEVTAVEITLEVNPLGEQVTVTAETGLAEDKQKVPQQVNIVSEDAIRQRTTAVLAQVAEEEVGASLQRTSPTIGAVLVRGLTEVGVYIDGVRYTNSTQRGGINTFFNLIDPTSLRAVEIQRAPNTAQYGSDGLGGTAQIVSRQPEFGFAEPAWHGELNTIFTSADYSYGGNALVTYGTKRFGILVNLIGRRINTLRSGQGIDSHSAITRFLGLPSDITGDTRLPDTAFTQYGAAMHLTYAPATHQQLSFRYQRSQQDGGKRYDQLLGGDGNLIAALRNLMLDFGYLRYFRQGFGLFDNFSATFSYNSQREERVNQGGQGNPFAGITHDKERTTSVGFSFYFDKQLWRRNNFLLGGDIYRDHVSAPSYTLDPATGAAEITRPRVPNGARYILAGLFVQDSFELIPQHLRLSGALRYNVASYRSRASNSPFVGGEPLVPDDSLRVGDFSGRVGAVATILDGFNLAINYSRGFRAPNITSLGSVGLVGVGFQVSASEVAHLGATVGSTADEDAVSTGVAVGSLTSETSNNFDLSLRFHRSRFDTELTGFVIDYGNTIVRQTMILPQGAVGLRLGSQTIERQNANGAVFVPLSTSPVLVQANFGGTRLKGLEYEADLRLTRAWFIGANYSYVRAEVSGSGEPPNLGGGGLPPQMAFFRLRYQPPRKRYWVEMYSSLADRQDRLSTLDLADRRTGASRSRQNIQNFFRRGACVRGLTTAGANGQCGSAGGILIATGETLAQVQNRILGNFQQLPLFSYVPGYGLINLRAGFKFDEKHEVSLDFENLTDKNYRAPGWGIDGPGRSFTVRYKHRF